MHTHSGVSKKVADFVLSIIAYAEIPKLSTLEAASIALEAFASMILPHVDTHHLRDNTKPPPSVGPLHLTLPGRKQYNVVGQSGTATSH